MINPKPIPGFPGYSITKNGKIWSEPKKTNYKQGRWLKPAIHKCKINYLHVTLCKKGKCYDQLIHRLVLETYVGPCPKGMECRHLNGNPQDNRLENLKWGTKSQNCYDAVQHGTAPGFKNKGRENGQSKLIEEQVILIFNAYHDGAYSRQELAAYFVVSLSCIQVIVEMKSWGYIWETI